MMQTARTASLLVLLLVLTSCEMRLHSMDPSDIDELTTCAISLDQARNNLLTQGFVIDARTENGFTTRLRHFDSVQSDRRDSIQDINILYLVRSAGPEQIEFTLRIEQVYRDCPLGCDEPGSPNGAGILQEPRYYRENVGVHRRIRSILCDRPSEGF